VGIRTERNSLFERLKSSLAEAIAQSRGERELVTRTFLLSSFTTEPDALDSHQIEIETMPDANEADGKAELEKP